MLQLYKLSNTGSKPTCLVLWTILKHDPTSHLATAHALDSVIHSDIARVISLRIIIIIIITWHCYKPNVMNITSKSVVQQWQLYVPATVQCTFPWLDMKGKTTGDREVLVLQSSLQ